MFSKVWASSLDIWGMHEPCSSCLLVVVVVLFGPRYFLPTDGRVRRGWWPWWWWHESEHPGKHWPAGTSHVVCGSGAPEPVQLDTTRPPGPPTLCAPLPARNCTHARMHPLRLQRCNPPAAPFASSRVAYGVSVRRCFSISHQNRRLPSVALLRQGSFCDLCTSALCAVL